MATYSSILAWRIPWTEEPGKLQSMWSHRSWTWLKQLTHAHTHTHTHTHTHDNCNLRFFRSLHTVLHSGLYQFTFPPTVYMGSLFSIPTLTFIVCKENILFSQFWLSICVISFLIWIQASDFTGFMTSNYVNKIKLYSYIWIKCNRLVKK